LTVTLIAFYAVLSVLAAVCQSDGMSSAREHHHGQAHHGSLHGVLCVFACQVNVASGLVSSAPGVQPVLLFLGTVVVSCFFGLLARQDGIRSRAPPCLSSSR
jgi:hypothetical protein